MRGEGPGCVESNGAGEEPVGPREDSAVKRICLRTGHALTSRRLRIALFIAATSSPAFSQTIRYVDADAPGANDGTSWEDAFRDLQDALDVAEDGDEIRFGDVQFRFRVQRFDSYSGTAEEHFLRGLGLHKAGDLDRAEQAYIEAIRTDGTYPNAYFNLGIIAQEREDLESAIELYRLGLAHKPDDALAHANLGKLYELCGDWIAALAAGEDAMRLEPALEGDVLRRRKRIQEKAEVAD